MTKDIPADSQNAFLKDKQYTDFNLRESAQHGTGGFRQHWSLTSPQKKISWVHTVELGGKLFTRSMVIVSECRGVVCDTEKC